MFMFNDLFWLLSKSSSCAKRPYVVCVYWRYQNNVDGEECIRIEMPDFYVLYL